MTDWASGYVADIEYLPGLYVEQAPGHLVLACLLNGIEPPRTEGGFTYCELGCGQGVTANVIAAANPQAEVVATDFNPAHIARARAAADQAGLSNIRFLELSFEDMLETGGLPDFDMVSLHGVWSWIAAEDRARITRFLRRHVKPGGLVSVTYNAMPGWTALLPVQRLLLEHARLGTKRSDESILEGLAWIEQLQACGSGVLGNATLLDQIRNGTAKAASPDRAVYLAHEYLNANWQPQYHMDTAALLGEAKLAFVGSTSLIDNFPDLVLKPDQRDVLATVPAGPLRETVKDYLVNRPFRRDLFVRGARRMPDSLRDARLKDFALALTVPRPDAKAELDVPAGKARLPDHQYGPVFDALAARPHTLAELAGLEALRGVDNPPSMVELAGVLVGSGQALPVPWGLSPADQAGAGRLNRAAAREVAEQRAPTAAIAAPLSGSGLTLSTMEAVVFDALATGAPRDGDVLTQMIAARLTERAVPLARDGEAVADAGARDALVAESVSWCLAHRVALWDQLRVW